ncbi:hypothetical protein MC885_011828 [Smutsia gigantea]|nr:hypothetical protein MC885_011828 [Smutsia gigantea]
MARFIHGVKVTTRDLGMKQRNMFVIPNSWKACKVLFVEGTHSSLSKLASDLLLFGEVTCGYTVDIAKTTDTRSAVGEHCQVGSDLPGPLVLLELIFGKKVIDVAAGSTHCLALTEDSEVHSWRSNNQCQHFNTLQSFVWSSCSKWSIGLRVPFVMDICSLTFEQPDLLLWQVSEGMDGTADWPPPQEKE